MSSTLAVVFIPALTSGAFDGLAGEFCFKVTSCAVRGWCISILASGSFGLALTVEVGPGALTFALIECTSSRTSNLFFSVVFACACERVLLFTCGARCAVFLFVQTFAVLAVESLTFFAASFGKGTRCRFGASAIRGVQIVVIETFGIISCILAFALIVDRVARFAKCGCRCCLIASATALYLLVARQAFLAFTTLCFDFFSPR